MGKKYTIPYNEDENSKRFALIFYFFLNLIA